MEKEKLETLIKKDKTQREIATILNCSQGKIKYWLKKHDLKTNHNECNKIIDRSEKLCPKCNHIKPIDDFYKRSNRNDYNGYCKECSNTYHTDRIKSVKIKMMDYMGNRCHDCDLNTKNSHPCIFDFHHLNQNEKDPNWKYIKFQKWDKIKNELDKCVMLCSNCHRTRHSQIEGW